MRVGLISYNGQARDAVGNHLAEKLAFFLERGADIRVILENAERLHPALARHVHFAGKAEPSGPVWDFLAQADLVIADFAQAYALLHFLPLLAGGKPRLLLEYHGITPPRFFTGRQRAGLERALARRGLAWCADYALVHSRCTHSDLLSATGFPEERVFLLDFPLDERLHPGAPAWSLRAHLGLSNRAGNAAVLLTVGRLAANKSIPVLIEALARLRDLPASAHIVIVGDSTDVYAEEERRCRELANRLGVGGRVHFLGSLTDERLADCYRDADVLVIPSLHEGFCVPVLEAMATGLPVIAARAAALPETVGGAGLTFAPGDAEDLARQVKRVLKQMKIADCRYQIAKQEDAHSRICNLESAICNRRIALVCFRFGLDIVGGAETSLRKIAQALLRRGRQMEVFTTCTRAEGDWTNELPAGTTIEDGLTIHRFPIDAHDRNRHLESVRMIIAADGRVQPALERAYLENSIHSRPLLANLQERIGEFDAVITGPYLFGLTWDTAQALPDKTLLLSCFHQEPLARLKAWPSKYGQVGGILYHSPEERELAEVELGINHPNGVEIGTYLEEESGVRSQESGGAKDSHSLLLAPHSFPRYLVYCGRYSRQKEVPRLLEFAARYQAERPGRFALVFMGQGEVVIPKQDWLIHLGRVDEIRKRAVLAGAAALVQLSRQESLSLVVLEAWAEGTPVIVDRRCAVLAGQMTRSGGGAAIGDYADFAHCLDDLWRNPDPWRERGRRGQSYVHEHYASPSAFADRILSAIAKLQTPLREQMRRQGLARAERSSRANWRRRFGQMVERILHDEPRPLRRHGAIELVHDQVVVKAGTKTALIPVRVRNQGTHALLGDGPARSVLFCAVGDGMIRATALAGLLMPGQMQALAVLADVPPPLGEYAMKFWLGADHEVQPPTDAACCVLTVGDTGTHGCSAPFLDAANEALVEIEQRRELPDDYLDVTEGRLARCKRWLKRKLLGNFKRGYVDVLSHQQSHVNREVLTALQQLTECCATLDHALRGLQERVDKLEEEVADISSFRASGEILHTREGGSQ